MPKCPIINGVLLLPRLVMLHNLSAKGLALLRQWDVAAAAAAAAAAAPQPGQWLHDSLSEILHSSLSQSLAMLSGGNTDYLKAGCKSLR
eukprot:scaffold98731_cov13-Tisochrysis_lutea.AAC.1